MFTNFCALARPMDGCVTLTHYFYGNYTMSTVGKALGFVWKWIRRFIVFILLLLISVWLLIQIPAVQNWMGRRAATYLSEQLGAKVQVGGFQFRILNKVGLQQVIVFDQQKDTLAYIGELQVRASDWFYFRNASEIKYLGLQDVLIRAHRGESKTWNYQFIVDYFSGNTTTKKQTNPFYFSIKEVLLERVRVLQLDEWRGRSMVAGAERLEAHIRKFDLKSKLIELDGVYTVKPEFRDLLVRGKWSSADSTNYYAALSKTRQPADTVSRDPEPFTIVADTVDLQKGVLEFMNRPKQPSAAGYFDERDIIITDLSGGVQALRITGDTVRAKVQNIKAKERSGLTVNKLSTVFAMHGTMMEFANLELNVNNSVLGPYYAMHYRDIDDMEDFINKVRIEARFDNALLAVKDIGFFTPYLKNHPQLASITGRASGTISDFTISDVKIATGQSILMGNYTMKGLTDIDKTLISFDSRNSRISLNDIKPWAPDLTIYNNRILSKLGVSTFNGKFAGTINEFVASGTLTSGVGKVDANFSYNNSKGDKGGFTADIANADIDAGYLLDIADLGNISFEGSAYTTSGSTTAPLLLEGLIKSASYKGYPYSNVLLDGKLAGDSLIAGININDKNLAGNFVLNINLADKESVYKASGHLDYANFKPLGLSADSIVYQGIFDVDFKGDNVDDFVGYARLDNSSIFNGRDLLTFDSLVLAASFDTGTLERVVSVHSSNIDADIKGHFKLSTAHKTFQYYLSRYYPSIIKAPTDADTDESMQFSIRTKEIEPYLRIIDSNLVGFNNAALLGKIDVENKTLVLNANIPYGGYKSIRLNSFVMGASGSDEGTLAVLAQVGSLSFNDSLSFPQTRLVINTNQDTTNIKLQTESAGVLGDAQIEADLITRSNGLEAKFFQSSIIFNNKKWELNEGGYFEIRDQYLLVRDIKLTTQNSEIALRTIPNDEGNWNDLIIDAKDVYLNDFLPYFLAEPYIGAAITGRTIVENPLGKAIVRVNIKARDLVFDNDELGDANIIAVIDVATGKITGDFKTDNLLSHLNAKLNFTLPDATHPKGYMDVDLDMKDQQIKFLDSYLNVVFDKVEGLATGPLRMVGPLSSPALIGQVQLNNVVLVPGYTKVEYTIDSAMLGFGDNYIDLGSMIIKDSRRRTGEVRGRLYHRFFDSLSFNIGVSSGGIEVLNTSAADNDLFYGTAVARAAFDITGPLENMRMRISGTPTDSSRIFIKLDDSRESDEADFIVFKQYGREIESLIDSNTNNLTIDIDLNANPLAEINVILDALTNDVIRARGTGNIKIGSSTVGSTVMIGRYDIDRGYYNYSFQTLIRKPFEIRGDGDNYIEWKGDPYEANLNLEADYTANNVSMRTLVSGEQSRTVLDQSAQNFKGNVNVKIYIKGQLSNPDISFGIDFPPGSVMRGNFSAQEMLNRIQDDQSELLKQVTYLIVFNSFAPYQQSGGSLQAPGADLAINTVSELLSNEMSKILTNVLGQVFNDRSLNVDVSTSFYNSSQLVDGNVVASTNYDRFAVDFKLNKSYLNNRIVVNLGSNFDAGINNTTSSGVQFLPDISVEFVLTPNRRLRFIVFKKDNLDFSGRRNRAGVSISWRRDYDKLFGEKPEELLIVENAAEN